MRDNKLVQQINGAVAGGLSEDTAGESRVNGGAVLATPAAFTIGFAVGVTLTVTIGDRELH